MELLVLSESLSAFPLKESAQTFTGESWTASLTLTTLMLGYLGKHKMRFFTAAIVRGNSAANFELQKPRSVISSKHGGCVIIPREEGYIR